MSDTKGEWIILLLVILVVIQAMSLIHVNESLDAFKGSLKTMEDLLRELVRKT